MIELNMLRYVLAAAETGSFSQAANRFGIKQSTLSQSIHYLESRLGLTLFTRTTRGVSPTLSARSILDRARHIVEDIDRLLVDSRALADGRAGALRIGFSGSLARGTLAATLNRFRDAFPAVTIEAREANRQELLRALERGTLDVALAGRTMSHHGLRRLGLWNEPLNIALSADHSLSKSPCLYWTDLRSARFVIPKSDPGPDIAAMIVARLSGPSLMPTIDRQDVGRDNLVAFAAGDQVALCTSLPPPMPGQRFVLRQIHDAFGPAIWEQCLYWRSDRHDASLLGFAALAAEHHGRSLEFAN